MCLMISHRLDYGTYGLMIATKDQDIRLYNQFYLKTVIKIYKVLSSEKDRKSSYYFNNNILIIILDSLEVYMTNYKLVVGKRHQIRLQTRGIVGDRIYNCKSYLKTS